METFSAAGPQLVVAGAVVTVATALLCFVLGRFVLRMNAALLLGAVTGAMTSTGAMQQVVAQARSSAPTLGYVGAYTFANVLLAIAGAVVVRF